MGINKTISKLPFCQIDFKMAYTTISIVVILLNMGRLTLAEKCWNDAGQKDCPADSKRCNFVLPFAAASVDVCKVGTEEFNEPGKCFTSATATIEAAAAGLPAVQAAGAACNKFTNIKCSRADKDGVKTTEVNDNFCKYTKGTGGKPTGGAPVAKASCSADATTCCVIPDASTTGSWDGVKALAGCVFTSKQTNNTVPTNPKINKDNKTDNTTDNTNTKTDKSTNQNAKSTSSECLKMPLFLTAAAAVAAILCI